MRLLPLLLFSATITLLTAAGCERATTGDRLFEVPYPVVDLAVPAGVSSIQTWVFAQSNLPTGTMQALLASGTDPDEVDVFGGLRCRLVSLTGEDFGEIERIELRACPVNTSGGCDRGNIVFSQGDLFRRRQQTINLNPQLLNFRELFLGSDFVRVELVFFPGQTTSRPIEARLEWAMAAFGNVN